MNVFTTNIVISDLLSGVLHSLAVHSTGRGRWSFGQLGNDFNNILSERVKNFYLNFKKNVVITGCNLYAMSICFSALQAIITFSAVAWERYKVITSNSIRLAITHRQARKVS